MPSDTTLNVNLTPDLYDFVKAAVKSGRYTSASEVVREALRSKRDQALREVERKIEEALESARRGEVYDGETVAEELHAMSRQRRAPRRAKR